MIKTFCFARSKMEMLLFFHTYKVYVKMLEGEL